MNLQTISSLRARFPVSQPKTKDSTTNLQFSPEQIRELLPAPRKDIVHLWEIIPDSAPKQTYFPTAEILLQKYEFKMMLFQFHQNIGGDTDSGDDYEKYLGFPNPRLRDLAYSIVDRSDSNDEKMYKIEQWVIENIEYVLDIKNYGLNEYWALPALTLARESGDCEDGAFLIHSLALHAGVPLARLRTYGGFVELEEGLFLLGGHAWTAYKRESDEEWVEVDWCYYPTNEPLRERTAMKNDSKYVDDFFYIDALKTVDTSLVNRIRKPLGGGLVNLYA